MASHNEPLRWNIIGTGLISYWFTKDIMTARKSPAATHIIQAIGSSSLEKAHAFITHAVYADPAVDIIYIGTPRGLHKQHCLDAIASGKHILCEKAFALNAAEAREVLAAAEAKGVFIMEAMWTRFHPLTAKLTQVLHGDKAIGDVRRTFCVFGSDMDVLSLPSTSRLKDPAMGAGSLLDIGIYALTWGLLTLDPGAEEKPRVVATQTLKWGIDVASSFILTFPSTGRQGILTSTTEARTAEVLIRIEGRDRYITVEGVAASAPRAFTVYPKIGGKSTSAEKEGKRYEFEVEGMGFYFEADAVAGSISRELRENEVMRHGETVRVLEILDEIRAQGGARFPQEVEV